MSLPPGKMRRSFPPVSVSSLGPSGTPDIELPFGEPNQRLEEIQTRRTIPQELRRRIRALSNNANRVRGRSPLIAAQCWQEAGRLLDQHAARYAEAWVCYSRALAIYPDLKPAISALLRLARSADATETIARLLTAALERSGDPKERCALLCESAVLEIRQNNLKPAIEKLDEAMSICPDAMVPRLLISLIVSSRHIGEGRQAEILGYLATRFEGTPLAAGFRLVAAQLEERAGRDSDPPLDPRVGGIDIPVAWVHLRYCLKNGLFKEASRTLSRIVAAVDDPFLKRVLRRIQSAVRMVGGLGPAKSLHNALPDPIQQWLLSISAVDVKANAQTAISALKAACAASVDPTLGAAFNTLECLRSVRTGQVNCPSADNSHLPEAVNRATRSFVRMASKPDTRDPDVQAANLYRAIERESWYEVLSLLIDMEKKTTDAGIRWALRMAATALRIEHLDAPEETLDAISLKEGDVFPQPLPAMMRRVKHQHRALADIAVAQANSTTEDPTHCAALLAWAAHHMEASDPFEAARLYTDALQLDPSLLFAVGGLRRTGTSGKELANLYVTAAEKSTGPTRGRALLSAGISYYLAGDRRPAGELMCEAALLLPDEPALGYAGLALALHSSGAPPAPVISDLLASDLLDSLDPSLVAPLALFADKEAAIRWYRLAAATADGDPVVEMGFAEAHFQARSPSPLSETLFSRLKQETDPTSQAVLYQRLAQIDRFIRDEDDPAAALSIVSLVELLPGHRSSLVRLLVYALKSGKDEDVLRALLHLSMTVTDEEDMIALSRLCTLRSKTNAELIRQIVLKNRATLPELTNLEGRTTDPEERLDLLTQITTRLPTSDVYRSRLADILGRFERRNEAISLYKESMENKACVVYNLHAMLRQMQSMGDNRLLVDTMVIQSDYWTQLDRRVSTLVSAAAIARDVLRDPKRAAAICMLALSADPTRREAFDMADELLTEAGDDPEEHIALMETRLGGVDKPIDRLVLHLKLKDLLGRFSDQASLEKRERHLKEAVAIVVNKYPGFDESLPLVDQAVDAEAWLEEVDHAVENERLQHDPLDDVALYVAFGNNFITFLEDEIRAEHYFKKALALDSTNETALRFMADLRLAQGAVDEAATLLERFLDHTERESHKLDAAMQLAGIFGDTIGDKERAERVLQVANRLAPLDIGPIEALADLYREAGDDFALSIHLDGALQRHSAAIAKTPTEKELYTNIVSISERQKYHELSAIAADVVDIIDGVELGKPRASWQFDSRIADPALEPVLCPPAISRALCDILRILTDFLIELLGIGTLPEDAATLERRDSLQAIVSALAPQFGIREIIVSVADIREIRIFSGILPKIVFPRRIHIAKGAVQGFAAGYALETLRLGLGIMSLAGTPLIRGVLGGLLKVLFHQTREYVGLQDGLVDRCAREIEKGVPKETLKAILPFRPHIEAALKLQMALKDHLNAPGYRVGLFAAGTVRDALQGLRITEGADAANLLATPGAGMLLSFLFSRDYLIARGGVL